MLLPLKGCSSCESLAVERCKTKEIGTYIHRKHTLTNNCNIFGLFAVIFIDEQKRVAFVQKFASGMRYVKLYAVSGRNT